MDPLSAIAAAVSIGKASLEGVQAVRKRLSQAKLSKDDLGEVREAIQLKAAILELREEKLQLREKNLELQKESSELAEELRAEQTRALDRERYQRQEIGSSVVITHPEHEGVYFCLFCFERRKSGILQPAPSSASIYEAWEDDPGSAGAGGSYRCNRCGASFEI